jgi:hypothetical protein
MTDVPLREYLEGLLTEQTAQTRLALTAADALELERIARVEDRVSAQGARFEQALTAQGVAVIKAETAAEKRFESVNEFRAQLADQQGTFMPREVAEAQITDLRAKLDNATRRLDELAGQAAGSKQTTAMMITIAIVLISAASFAANYVTSH